MKILDVSRIAAAVVEGASLAEDAVGAVREESSQKRFAEAVKQTGTAARAWADWGSEVSGQFETRRREPRRGPGADNAFAVV